VSDFRPKERSSKKIKKESAAPIITLERTDDILQGLGAEKEGRILVGFAAETENVVENAREKLLRKNLDLIVANDIAQPGAGFSSDTNAAVMIDRTGAVTDLPLREKTELAVTIIDKVAELKKNQGL
jgi:phosphopantothenoylcysteine decarboxylase/phosphopantothenate--cysteine ligase